MIDKRVMLVGALFVGVSYTLALTSERPSESAAAATPEHRSASVISAQALPHAPQSQSAEVRLQRELTDLAAGVTRLTNDLSALRAEKQPAPSPPEAVKTAEQEQAEHEEYMAGVERAFEQEPRNEHWASGTSELLRNALGTEPIMLAALRGIECRARSCRMEIRDDGSAAFAQELPLMVHALGAVLPEVRFTQSDLGSGAQLHILYMSKSDD
jgi:hypothetical protein